MQQPIEITSTGALRIETGSRFGMNLVPLEFCEPECVYRHPQFGARIKFHAKWVNEKRAIDREGLVERSVSLGLLLIEGELLAFIGRALERRDAKVEAQSLVLDCYELIIAFLRASNERAGYSDLPHVYATSIKEPWKSRDSVEVGPDVLKKLNAAEIY
jgi:hypothetical protein